MKKSYGKSVATHTDPESCGVTCKGDVEALTWDGAGRVFSRVRHLLRDADAVGESGRPQPGAPISRGAPRSRAVTDPVHVPPVSTLPDNGTAEAVPLPRLFRSLAPPGETP